MFRRATTIREVLMMLGSMGLGLSAALEAQRRWGGWWPAAAFIAGALVFPVGWVVWRWTARRVWPEWPRCASGRCGGWAYRLARHVVYEGGAGKQVWAGVYRCGCGDEYVLAGRRLMRIGAGGAWEPFMRDAREARGRRGRGGLGEWVRDEGAAVRPRLIWEYTRGRGWKRVGSGEMSR